MHLRLRYMPVAVILNVLAIQTGTNFKPTGKGYHITADTKAPMPGEVIQRSYSVDQLSRMPLGDWPPEFDPLTVWKYFSAKSAFCLGKEPASVRSETDSNVRFEASSRFHKLVQQLISAGTGTPPGTWSWNVKAVEISGTGSQAKFVELAGETSGRAFSDPEFQMLMRNLSQKKGEGKLLAFFLTGSSLSAVEPQPQAAPQDIRELLTPDGTNTSPAPPEALPYGIPIEGKPGMVLSPYADDKGIVDVSGLKRGTLISCPCTGRHFRAP